MKGIKEMESNIDFKNLDSLTSREDSEEYKKFTDKFKPKKTTDDCFTPVKIYEAIKEWVIKEYGIDKSTPIIRPFYPGGDYENYNYPDGCIVIDNPPFSILSKIIRFYVSKNIKFFLFAPTLALTGADIQSVTYIVAGANIIYENGAKLNTSFATNLDTAKIRVEPELLEIVDEIQKTYKNKQKKYKYPDNVVSPARLAKLAGHGVKLKIMPNECKFIRQLDSQKESGKRIYGAGYLISEKAAARKKAGEKKAAEKATEKAAERAAEEPDDIWTLSEREKGIIKGLK